MAGKKLKEVLLVVEDDEILLRALYLMFNSGKYTIATATDGETALKMAERIKPDMVLLDLLMPKMNGFEFLKVFKAHDELKKIPVIVLSNLGDSDSKEKAKALGAIDYFVKANINLTSLADKIKQILSQKT
ncbi:MAG: hypothetical protein COU29_00430 [Candidatus Magasanikbacteria bacterium CG10_big_fil_rev_8_21_14_0_10_36_32]|uniref:Response regulatory domain-containing protein n=1 Tax=Candidatus Magasanikbacteria bacterium CG10_big_fil_rev_8_21_14_0_10_36_32 TaxID=1974646 RepID=A0A2M6W7G9_9BACT|nr:MAG: hypothetical protein COU29_00430 [Candidatus Magasanikbacteria bacterium CG10_big_fil_rev_8_21_14_0_10_36_32]